MKINRRASLVILLLALIVLIGVVFRTFFFNAFVLPIAAVFWLIWRLLLSVDQDIYWGLLIFSALIVFILRLTKVSSGFIRASQPDPNTALETVSYWRTSIVVTRDEIEGPNLLKSNLGKLLAAVYARQQPGTPPFEIYTALTQRQIPLPGSTYAFLFPEEQSDSKWSLGRFLRFARQAPVKRYRKWTGRDVADYYQSIDEVITLMESSLEVRDDDEHASIDKN